MLRRFANLTLFESVNAATDTNPFSGSHLGNAGFRS
jgi:hypothetical protein